MIWTSKNCPPDVKIFVDGQRAEYVVSIDDVTNTVVTYRMFDGQPVVVGDEFAEDVRVFEDVKVIFGENGLPTEFLISSKAHGIHQQPAV